MKIAFLGYGKMGQLIEKFALSKGHQTIARFSQTLGTPEKSLQTLAQADIAIDFSQSSVVLTHLDICLSLGKPIVIGTTGWEEQLTQAQHMVQQAQGSCLYAPNFSIGIYLFQWIISYAASLFQPFKEYGVRGIESHHHHKRDQPSGTAKILSQKILKHLPRLSSFDFSSVREGEIPGTHTLYFESPVDSLTFTHEAHNRNGFAEGALKAAEWLLPRQGFFTLDEMMHDQLKETL